jgi:phosphatidylethanolamine/phosphatidyl-N-methylethanolamine N-methyltransferase
MEIATRLRNTIDDRFIFLREFLRSPRQIGSVTPSSRFLERRIVDLADTGSARTVVELGAGTGGTTRAILDAMAPNARLLVVEINVQFCALLRQIDDARLIVHCGSAHELRDALARYGLPAPEVIISGIPFSSIDRRTGELILATIASALAPGGCFVAFAYQWSRQVDDLSRPLLGPARVEAELFNIPPARLYRWEKRAVRSAVEDGRARAAAD